MKKENYNSMNIDSFFSIGSTHRVCQDYTIHNDKQVILSDGCSSAQYSDTGARILAHTASYYSTFSYDWILHYAFKAAETIGLTNDCLCATLIKATANEANFVVEMSGDGTIISRRAVDGELEIFDIGFSSGAPYYLKYNFDGRQRYLAEFGDEFSVNGEIQPEGYLTTYPEGVIKKTYPFEEYDMVAIFSDGLSSFQNKSGHYPMEEVLREAMAIKGFAGSFVQRRCRKMLEKLKNDDCFNTDDFSMGAIKRL